MLSATEQSAHTPVLRQVRCVAGITRLITFSNKSLTENVCQRKVLKTRAAWKPQQPESTLKRSPGGVNPVAIGIGVIIGAGLFR